MSSSEAVQVHIEGDVAWVVIDSPPVNATSQAVRAGLVEAVKKAANARVAILKCAGRTFVAGGDMSEFDGTPVEPHLPDVVQMIEDSTTPFLALMHGTVLGGGLELAAACAWRIAKTGTKFGLPEVNVGIIPGAGGSQRMPRLVGMETSIEMACKGKLIGADKILALGGIDQIADDLDQAATDFIADLPDRPVAVSQRTVAPYADEVITNTQAALAKSRGMKAPLENLTALQWANEPFEIGQPKERKRHMELRQSAESRALRHAFFSERAASKPDAIAGATAHDLTTIAVVGGGLMGAGIATAALNAGLAVRLIEREAEAAEAATARVQGLIDGAVKRGKATAEQAAERMARFSAADTYAHAAGVDLAIEAVFEDLGVKQDVFASLAAHVDDSTILATNTSYLDPREIFGGIANQSRCIGLHFFSPAHIMKLLEVVKLPETDADVIATGFALGKRLRKVPVLTGICDGFIGNRILSTYRRAADYLLADGALPHQIDAAMRGFGMAMGPYEVQDMAGLQISWANRKRNAATRPANERYIPLGDQLCEMERFGRRSSKGWYDYDENGKASRSAEVEALIEAYSAEQGINRREFSDDDITSRLLAVMASEGARIVEEGIAERSGDVDIVKLHGYGFPRWRGGPMRYAEEIGIETTKRNMKLVAEESPNSWVIATAFKD